MKVVRSHVTLFALLVSTVVLAACGGNASLSPVGPSRSTTGASISGTVSGTGVNAVRALDGGPFGVLATSSVTVSIAGTNISTAVDGQGQFTLNDVPTGTVTLNFTAPGASAAITLTGIGPTDNVQITVTLNGSTAHVDSERHSAPDNNKGEFQGRITAIDATAKTFQVSGMTVKVAATTTIRHGNKTVAFADLKVGDHVEVKGTKEGTTLTASEIKVESDNDQGDDDDRDDDHKGTSPTTVSGLISASTGTCPAVTFTVSSAKITVNSATTYPGTTCADATKNGANVKVTGTKQTDGSILATSVALVTPTSSTVSGVISAATGTCPAVTFTVQSTKVTVNSATTYGTSTCADATKNGATVNVTGTKQADGSILAASVSLTTAAPVTVTGVISGSTGTCPAVTFTVASTKVTVSSATAYTSTTCADATKNGANVKVTGAKQSDGSITATGVSLAI
jgi:hypothetical protein